MTDPAAWLLANLHALGARRCAERLDTTPSEVVRLYREALRRVPRHERIPISKAFQIHELRSDFTPEALADIVGLPLPVVERQLDLLSGVAC